MLRKIIGILILIAAALIISLVIMIVGSLEYDSNFVIVYVLVAIGLLLGIGSMFLGAVHLIFDNR